MQVGGLLQPTLAKVMGNGNGTVPTPEVAEQVAKKLAEDPALLTALRNAIQKAEESPKPEAVAEAKQLVAAKA